MATFLLVLARHLTDRDRVHRGEVFRIIRYPRSRLADVVIRKPKAPLVPWRAVIDARALDALYAPRARQSRPRRVAQSAYHGPAASVVPFTAL